MPTLTQPAIGSTAWGTQMNTNLQVLQTQLTNAMQGRIQRDSATQISLQRYTGDTVEVNGLNVSMGSSGLAFNASTTDTITSTGADSGSKVAASTLYYVYVSNASASPFPSSLSLSTQAYTAVNGVRYLGSSGNAANWRFVGYAYTDSSGNFQDSLTQRFVANYYNRRPKALYSDPGYLNDNLVTSYTVNGNYTPANAGTGSKIEFIANGEDSILIGVHGSSSNAGINGFQGVGIDSATSATFTSKTVGTSSFAATKLPDPPLSEGYHYLQFLIASIGGVHTVYADLDRANSAADPNGSVIFAQILA